MPKNDIFSELYDHVFIEQCLKVHNKLYHVKLQEVFYLILVIEIKNFLERWMTRKITEFGS